MKATVLAAAAGSVLALSAASAVGAQGDRRVVINDDKPVVITDTPVVVADRVTAKAKVVDVDEASRMVTLQQSNGTKTQLKVGDKVRNLDQIRKGDELVVRYYRSMGLDLRKIDVKEGSPPASASRGAVQLAPKGGAPGAAASDTRMITAQVDAVDYGKRLVTLRGPEGEALTVRAGDRVKNLEQIKKGDRVEAIYTQALAVSMEKPKA